MVTIFLFRFANSFRWWLDCSVVRFSLQHVDRGYQILKNIIRPVDPIFVISRIIFYIGVFRETIILQVPSPHRMKYHRFHWMEADAAPLGRSACGNCGLLLQLGPRSIRVSLV